jgi:hypothetical protein
MWCGPHAATVVFDVADVRVEREVLGHALVRVEVDRVEPRLSRRCLGELEQQLADAGAVMRGIDRDVVDEEAVGVDP